MPEGWTSIVSPDTDWRQNLLGAGMNFGSSFTTGLRPVGRGTVGEGGRKKVEETKLNFKREADRKGRLNPGKMIGWQDPEWDYVRKYAWPGMIKAARL